MLLWTYLIKGKTDLLVKEEEQEELSKTAHNRYIYSGLAAIITLYFISIGIAFINISIAIIFPVIMIPAIIILARVFNPKTK
jgi:low temperature requirement protein LtrA